MAKRGRKPMAVKRQQVHIRLKPEVIEATDALAKMYGTTRTELIELGLAVICKEHLEMLHTATMENLRDCCG